MLAGLFRGTASVACPLIPHHCDCWAGGEVALTGWPRGIRAGVAAAALLLLLFPRWPVARAAPEPAFPPSVASSAVSRAEGEGQLASAAMPLQGAEDPGRDLRHGPALPRGGVQQIQPRDAGLVGRQGDRASVVVQTEDAMGGVPVPNGCADVALVPSRMFMIPA